MKKILFLLLVTISSYAQTYQNPTFGTVKSMTAPTVSTTPTLGTIEANGTISKIVPNNVPITYTPINYAPSSTSIADQLAGIDTRLGQIGNVTAGVTRRVHLTGDNITVTAGTFFASNTTGKGATAAGTPQQTLSNNDDQKQYFTKDVISVAVAEFTSSPPGLYPGQLTVSSDPTPGTSKQRFTIEIYKCNNGGTPIASGITGAPVGDLGVTVIAILDSGLINVVAGSLTNIGLQGNLASTLTLNTGERLRYHVSAEKIGVDGGAVTMNVYYGSNYNSYYDIPVTFKASNIINDSGVAGINVDNALNTLNTNKANLASPTFTGNLAIGDNPLGSTPNKLTQTTASTDYWSIYGQTNTTDRGIMVFEVGDNAEPIIPIGQSFEFRYTNGSSGVNKTPFTIDYNSITADTDFYIKGNTYIRQLRTLNDLGGSIGLLGSYFDAFGAGSKNDVLAFVYGNNSYKIATNGVVRFSLDGTGVANINSLSGTGTRQIVADASGNLSATTAVVPYTKYVATLTQTGTSAPTATVLENTTGSTVTWTRTGSGLYTGTFSSAILASGKRFLLISPRTGGGVYYDFLTTSSVQIATASYVGVGTDALLNETSIEIRVYP